MLPRRAHDIVNHASDALWIRVKLRCRHRLLLRKMRPSGFPFDSYSTCSLVSRLSFTRSSTELVLLRPLLLAFRRLNGLLLLLATRALVPFLDDICSLPTVSFYISNSEQGDNLPSRRWRRRWSKYAYPDLLANTLQYSESICTYRDDRHDGRVRNAQTLDAVHHKIRPNNTAILPRHHRHRPRVMRR